MMIETETINGGQKDVVSQEGTTLCIVLSVNQLAIKIKLSECLKSINLKNYPVKLDKGHVEQEEEGRHLRTSSLR